MEQETLIFTCEDTFESIMTCVYEAWNAALKCGHSHVRLELEDTGDLCLFCQYRHIDGDFEKTQKVVRSIQKKISFEAYTLIYHAAMSFCKEKADIIYRFLVVGFYYGREITKMLQIPAVYQIFELSRKVTNEAHQFREFVRFSRLENQVLCSFIEPKCDVLSFLAYHFSDRMPSENWMIIDKNRMTALVHPADRDYFMTPLTTEELTYIQASRDKNDPYPDLWKSFFMAVAVEARTNPRCQRNFLPVWYRKNMTEFQ